MELPTRSLEEMINQQEIAIRAQRFNPLQDPPDIPILLPGGVGDIIMAIPVVQAIAALGPVSVYTAHRTTFDYFAPESLPRAKPIPLPPYTWFIDINSLVRFKMMEGFTGFRRSEVEDLWKKTTSVYQRSQRLQAIANQHPLQDTALARFARELALDRRSLPFYCMGMKAEPRIQLPRAAAKPYITIHDGYEAESAFIVPGRATKTWKWNYWNELVSRLHKEYPSLEVIQLGTSTGREIEGVDHCLINKTTLPDAFELIKHSSLHIDGDSGLSHAATALSVPSVVLFGPTPDYFFGYPENINLRSNVCADACFWLTRDWLGKCPIGHRTPKCMDEITPDQVMAAIKKTGALEEEHPPLEPLSLVETSSLRA